MLESLRYGNHGTWELTWWIADGMVVYLDGRFWIARGSIVAILLQMQILKRRGFYTTA
jgi:hypothetical protein